MNPHQDRIRKDADQPLQFGLASLLEPAAMLSLARALLAVLPLRWLLKALRLSSRKRGPEPANERTSRIAEDIQRRITYIGANYHALGNCLPQGVAAAAMLRLRGIPSVLHFGVLQSSSPDKPLRAHAWLTASGLVVTGGGTRSAFFELNPSDTVFNPLSKRNDPARSVAQ